MAFLGAVSRWARLPLLAAPLIWSSAGQQNNYSRLSSSLTSAQSDAIGKTCTRSTQTSCPIAFINDQGESTCYQANEVPSLNVTIDQTITVCVITGEASPKGSIGWPKDLQLAGKTELVVVGCPGKTASIGCQGDHWAIDAEHAKVVVSGVSLTGCTGGAVRAQELSLFDVRVSKCGSSQRANVKAKTGAVFVLGDVTVVRSTFTNNSSPLDGGAILALGVINVSDSAFEGNSAGSQGGALRSQKDIYVYNTSFLGNTAAAGGALYSLDHAVVRLSQFNNNTAIAEEADLLRKNTDKTTGTGGAVYGTNTNISDSTFDGNQAGSGGGAVMATVNGTYTNCTVENSRADRGAGISVGSSCNVRDSNFRGNVAVNGGGGLRCMEHTYVNNSVFVDNVSGTAGGAVYMNQPYMLIEHTTFRNNTGPLGGSIQLIDGTIANSNFSENQADRAGGAIAGFGEVNVTGCLFASNNADIAGGALLDSFDAAVGTGLVKLSAFISNTLCKKAADMSECWGRGGAINIQESLSIEDSSFLYNTARTAGAAVYGDGHLNMTRCQMHENTIDEVTGPEAGAGAVMMTGNLTIDSSLFKKNVGAIGGAASTTQQLISRNSSYISNRAATGGGLWSGATLDLEGQNNFSCNDASEDGGAYYGMGKVTVDLATTLLVSNKAGAKHCAGVGSNGASCDPNTIEDYCQCEFAQTNDTCGAPNSQCVSAPNTALGYQCSCTAPGLWAPQGLGCRPCASCGDGSQLAACTATADTQCACPANRTGNNCAQPCALPPACLAADPTTPCTFDAANPAKGVRCLQCKADHFVDSQGLCQKCSTCGSAGTLTANCTTTADTVCLCPVGKTGNDCASDCQYPPNCINVDSSSFRSCSFNRSVFYLGVKCLNCDDNYYLLNSTCHPYTVCTNGTYESAAPTATTDRQCMACRTIPDCQVAKPCAGTQDTTCLTCKPGYLGSLCEVSSAGQSGSDTNVPVIVTSVVVSVVVVASIIGALWYRRNRTRALKKTVEQILAERIYDIQKTHEWTDAGTTEADKLLRRVKGTSGQITRSQFALLEELGSGAFGTVHRGVVFSAGHAVVCAIKMTKQQDEAVRAEFLREAELIKHLDHENVVSTVGVCMEESGELYLLLEFMPLGDLRGYIKKNPDTSPLTRTWFALEMARGLGYLASEGIIHRDIAARNVLVAPPRPGSHGQPTAKISDLGLARVAGAETQTYVKADNAGALLPVRWMAPEAVFDGTYSLATDVWSFGIAAWETFTNGELPFEFLQTPGQVIQAIRHGVRLLRPPECPEEVYSVMFECWNQDPDSRPKFTETIPKLEQAFKDLYGEGYSESEEEEEDTKVQAEAEGAYTQMAADEVEWLKSREAKEKAIKEGVVADSGYLIVDVATYLTDTAPYEVPTEHPTSGVVVNDEDLKDQAPTEGGE